MHKYADRIDQNIVTNKTKIADEFNKYFSQIGLTTNKGVPESPKMYKQYQTKPITNSMFVEHTTHEMAIE